MTIHYYPQDLPFIMEDINSYIDQSNECERQIYKEELERVKDDFIALAHSGVFHDAIGKLVNVSENGERIELEVETEY